MILGGLRTQSITKQSQEGMPLITIVTVVRNGEKTLEETILSVINQTYKNIEYIIIDGASTDGTLNVIKKYEDRVDYWISEPDKGIYDAMNKGINLANGDWINFMNSGDGFYENGTVTLVNQYISLASKVVVFYGNTSAYFNSGTSILTPPKTIPSKMRSMPFCHQSCFIETNVLKNRYFNIQYKICADYDFFQYVYNTYLEFQYIPVTIAKYNAMEGVSFNNPIQLKKEIYKINNVFTKKNNYLFFIFDIIYTGIIFQLKKCIPLSILKYYRNSKFK